MGGGAYYGDTMGPYPLTIRKLYIYSVTISYKMDYHQSEIPRATDNGPLSVRIDREALSSGDHGDGLKPPIQGTGGVEPANDDSRFFKAWGTVEVPDREGQVIEVEKLKKVLKTMEERGAGGVPLIYGHSNNVVGSVFSQTVTDYQLDDGRKVPAVMIEGEIFKHYRIDDKAWDEVKAGILKGVSLGAMNYEKQRLCTKEGDCAEILKDPEGMEWSLAKEPMNPLSYIFEINGKQLSEAITKDASVMELSSMIQSGEVQVKKSVYDYFKEHGVTKECKACDSVVLELMVQNGYSEGRAVFEAQQQMDALFKMYDPEGAPDEVNLMTPEEIQKAIDEAVTKAVEKNATELESVKKEFEEYKAKFPPKKDPKDDDAKKGDDDEKAKKGAGGSEGSDKKKGGEPDDSKKEVVWPEKMKKELIEELKKELTDEIKKSTESVKEMVNEEVKKALDGSTITMTDGVTLDDHVKTMVGEAITKGTTMPFFPGGVSEEDNQKELAALWDQEAE